MKQFSGEGVINSLNAQLNPIHHLLALLGAHPILHISGVRVEHKLCAFIFSTSVVWNILTIRSTRQDIVTNKTLSRNVQRASTLCAWRHTATCRSHGYNALGDAPWRRQPFLRSIMQALATEEVEKVGKVEYCGSIRTLRSLPDQGRDVCEVWLRSVQKCEFV
jgi:hypothetical protein